MSFIGPKRYTPVALDIDDLPPIDFVVISHNHYDHLDTNSIQRLPDHTVYLVPENLGPWFEDNDITGDRVYELPWWQDKHFGAVNFTAPPLNTGLHGGFLTASKATGRAGVLILATSQYGLPAIRGTTTMALKPSVRNWEK